MESDPGSARVSRAGRGVSPRQTSSSKAQNEACRSCLQDAIRSIGKAASYWPFPHEHGLIETLHQLKAKIKADLSSSEAEVYPPRRASSAVAP